MNDKEVRRAPVNPRRKGSYGVHRNTQRQGRRWPGASVRTSDSSVASWWPDYWSLTSLTRDTIAHASWSSAWFR